MELTKAKLNRFLFFKLPSAFICGVRVISLDESNCSVSVKHRWINQNPFNSMYFAVQAMAAELSTGALVMNEIKKNRIKMSMLVISSKADYSKKATGRITFKCIDGHKVREAIRYALQNSDGHKFWMKSIGTDEEGNQVSEMNFEWSIRVKLN